MDDTGATAALFGTRVVGITGIRSWPRTEIRMSRYVMNSIMIKVKYTENENIYRKYILFIGKVRTYVRENLMDKNNYPTAKIRHEINLSFESESEF